VSIEKGNVKIHYLGHATFIFETNEGSKIIVDPWLDDNPQCPDNLKSPENIEYILITHGHFDHIGNVSQVFSNNKNAKLVGNLELCTWYNSKGVSATLPMNHGGTQVFDQTKVTMVNAVHGSGIQDGDKLVYGGIACGYVVQFSNGFSVYIAGDTGVFMDMKLISEVYNPDLAIIPIGDHYTMGPVEGLHACRMLNVKHVVPCHYGTFPVLVGDPAKFKKLVEKELDTKVHILNPGDEL